MHKKKSNSKAKDTEDDKKEKEEALRLISIPGIGSKSALRLTEYAGSARVAMQMSESEVAGILDKNLTKKFLMGREKENIHLPIKQLENLCMDFVPITINEYPKRLRNIPDPPFGLFIKGRLPENEVPTVAVIGARTCSEYGKNVAYAFGKKLGNYGIQIISGMARGIDGIAQRGALDGNGQTYAVLGCGADYCYPPENRKLYLDMTEKGGILSEYPPGTEPKHQLFPARNRIISGLADVILVVEARKRSGTYITVMQALEQNRDVFAVPGRITDALSDGCNHLLGQGAGVAVSPEVILQELGTRYYKEWNLNKCSLEDKQNIVGTLQTERGTEDDKERTEALVLSCLEVTPVDIGVVYERLQEKKEVSMEELMLILTKMQICGKVENRGNYYRLSFTL